jgi:hypothetical protein
MKTWRYQLPFVGFLLVGRRYKGEVVARTKSEARARLKFQLGLDHLPHGLLLVST